MMELMQATGATPVTGGLDRWAQKLSWLKPLQSSVEQLSAFNDPRHVYAMCLSCMTHQLWLDSAEDVLLPIVLSHLLNLFAH